MLASVASSFGFDGEGWTIRRLDRWYRRHVGMIEERQALITPEALALLKKSMGGR